MDHLLVMPLTPFEIAMSKVWANGLVITVAVGLSLYIVVRTVLGVPIADSIPLFMIGVAIYLHPDLWAYLAPLVERYDAVVLSLLEYAQNLATPQRFIMPAINPYSTTNKDLSEAEIADRLAHYDIPTDLPLVVQVSRFDKWKDPQGVIDAFKIARKQVDCTLVLLGNIATDDPEGQEVFASLCDCSEERIRILSVQDSALVNALQCRAAVVLQKSLREGFGLTVTEAMWKGAAVIGGNVGGIKHQIEDGVNGFLVDNVEQAADRIVDILKDPALRDRVGRNATETVKRRFLMTRLMEDWLDLLGSFEADFRFKGAIQS